jgi:hypothetical protein
MLANWYIWSMRCWWAVVGSDAGASPVSIAICALTVSAVALKKGRLATRSVFDLALIDISSETDDSSD